MLVEVYTLLIPFQKTITKNQSSHSASAYFLTMTFENGLDIDPTLALALEGKGVSPPMAAFIIGAVDQPGNATTIELTQLTRVTLNDK